MGVCVRAMEAVIKVFITASENNLPMHQLKKFKNTALE